MKSKISVIIPIHNERENLELLMSELRQVLVQMKVSYEVLFIDDGSKDGSFSIIEKFTRDYPQVKCIRFKRRFGQTAAIMAGIDHAQGEYIIPMDGDLQNDPHDIPFLLEEVEKGYDIVSGWRKIRKDHFIRTFFLKLLTSIYQFKFWKGMLKVCSFQFSSLLKPTIKLSLIVRKIGVKSRSSIESNGLTWLSSAM